MKGYVYILTNESMPGLVKIGRSFYGGGARAVALFSSGVPQPFVVEFEILFADCVEGEREVHDVLQDYRVSGRREFFRCSVPFAIEFVLACACIERGILPQNLSEFDAYQGGNLPAKAAH